MASSPRNPAGSPRFALIAAVMAGILIVGVGFFVYALHENPKGVAGTLLGASIGGAFQLVDQNGKPFSDADLKGKWHLVFFGYTHCPDTCPTTLVQLAQIARGAAVPGLRVLFISVDPARDTPAVLARYLQAFDPRFRGLSGDAAAITRIAGYFGVAFDRVELPGGDYTMDHSTAVFLTDRAGRIAAIFTPPFEVAAVSADLARAAPHLGGQRERASP